MIKRTRIASLVIICLLVHVTAFAQTAPKTLAELQTRISEILAKPELAPAMVGVKVTSLDTGRVLFEENSAKLLRPASNMKLYTVATALDKLTPDYRFKTSVYATTKPTPAGVVRGDLTIYGRGDPSFAARFNNGDYLKAINDLAARIVAAGVKRVEGDLVGDETYFVGPKYGSGWEWEDLAWYYGAEISPLTINDNALVIVMIETLEGVANADEIAAVHGVDAVIIGNNDLSNFSGWSQTDPRYQDAVTLVHNAALRAGKYFGNAGAQYLNGHRLSAATRIVQNGPARDGWTRPGRGRGPGPEEEPVIGLPGAEAPAGRGRGGAE